MILDTHQAAAQASKRRSSRTSRNNLHAHHLDFFVGEYQSRTPHALWLIRALTAAWLVARIHKTTADPHTLSGRFLQKDLALPENLAKIAQRTKLPARRPAKITQRTKLLTQDHSTANLRAASGPAWSKLGPSKKKPDFTGTMFFAKTEPIFTENKQLTLRKMALF